MFEHDSMGELAYKRSSPFLPFPDTGDEKAETDKRLNHECQGTHKNEGRNHALNLSVRIASGGLLPIFLPLSACLLQVFPFKKKCFMKKSILFR